MLCISSLSHFLKFLPVSTTLSLTTVFNFSLCWPFALAYKHVWISLIIKKLLYLFTAYNLLPPNPSSPRVEKPFTYHLHLITTHSLLMPLQSDFHLFYPGISLKLLSKVNDELLIFHSKEHFPVLMSPRHWSLSTFLKHSLTLALGHLHPVLHWVTVHESSLHIRAGTEVRNGDSWISRIPRV